VLGAVTGAPDFVLLLRRELETLGPIYLLSSRETADILARDPRLGDEVATTKSASWAK
jgi:hypothetical protein